MPTPVQPTDEIRLTQYSHGAGCGCKIAPKVLDQILHTSLQRLSHTCDLIVVTSRQHCIRQQTLEWIQLHFPHIFSDVQFGNHWALSGTSRKKSEICRWADLA